MTEAGRAVSLPLRAGGLETPQSKKRAHLGFSIERGAPPIPFTSDVRFERLKPLLDFYGPERLLQINGPTGMGKTTLLANYATAMQQSDTQCRWLTLHPSDTVSTEALWEALADAVGPGNGAQSDAPITNPPCERREHAKLVLIVDANSLELGPQAKALAELLHTTCDNLHICLISRRPNTALLAELRSAHIVRSMDPAALLFTAEETRRYCEHAGKLPSEAAITWGWPLVEAVASFLDIGNSSCMVADRLLDHAGGLLEASIHEGIWLGLSEEARGALMDTAMLDWIDERFLARVVAPLPVYPLVREVAGLAPLTEVRRGAEGGFSIHPLLRAFAARQLASQLESDSSQRRERVYRQALNYHAERRAPEAAIALVQDTGDHGLARIAFETFTSTELLRASGYNRVRSAMAQLTPEAAEQSGQIRITQAVVAMKEGRFPEARRLLETTRETLNEEMAYQSPSMSRIYADFIIAQHVFAFHSHTELTEEHLAEGYFWSSYTNDMTNAAFVYALRSLHYLRRGEVALAQEQIEISRDKYERAMSYYGLGSALLVDGMIAMAAGRLARAASLAGEARVLIARAMPDEVGLMAVAECVLCEVELERGHINGLFERINAALRDLEACDGWPDAFVIGYRVGTRAALACNDPAQALDLLDRAIRLMRGRGLVDIQRYCHILRAGVMSRLSGHGSGDVAPEDEDMVGLTVTSRTGWRENDEKSLLHAKRYLALGNYAAIIPVADRLEKQAAVSGRPITIIRALLLRVIAAFEQHQQAEAVALLTKAITLAETEEILEPFAEHGQTLLLVLEALKADSAFRVASRAIRSFCTALTRIIVERAQDAGGGLAFAPRELQVLRCLLQRQSTKVIARDLGISASAVKFHLNNIYRKLGVNKRAEAVAEVQRRGIVI